MNRSTRLVIACVFVAFSLSGLAASPVDASFISMSPDPLLGGNLATAGPPISSPFGYVTFTIANITETSNVIIGGNDFIHYNASPILTFYKDANMTEILTSSTFQGSFDIEILGRVSPFQSGSFNFQFLSSVASGTVGGTPVSVQLDPCQTSGGTTTITPGPGLGQYTIDTTAIQYSQFSIDGGPFTSIPPFPLVGAAVVPEPASLGMLAMGLVSLAVFFRRRTK